MALVLDDPELESRLRDLAAASGRTPEELLRERLYVFRSRPKPTPAEVEARLRIIDEITEPLRDIPDLDPRPTDEILGYGADGVPE